MLAAATRSVRGISSSLQKVNGSAPNASVAVTNGPLAVQSGDGVDYVVSDGDDDEDEFHHPRQARVRSGQNSNRTALGDAPPKAVVDGLTVDNDLGLEVCRYEYRVAREEDFERIVRKLQEENARLRDDLERYTAETRDLRRAATDAASSGGWIAMISDLGVTLLAEQRNITFTIFIEMTYLCTDAFSIISDAGVAGRGTGGVRIEAKIVELSKRIRKLSMALERERAVSASLTTRLKAAEEQLQNRVSEKSDQASNQAAANGQTQIDIKSMREKLAQANRKVEEERAQSYLLRTELRQMQKLLVSEIGEDSAGVAKDKVRELTAALQTAGARAGRGAGDEEPTATIAAVAPAAERRGAAIRKLENQRRSEFERALEELKVGIRASPFAAHFLTSIMSYSITNYQQLLLPKQQTKVTNADLVRKCEATASRTKYLEKQANELRSRLGVLTDKAEKDDELVRALREELARTAARGKDSDPPSLVIASSVSHSARDDILVNNLRNLCAEQKSQILELTGRVEHLELELAATGGHGAEDRSGAANDIDPTVADHSQDEGDHGDSTGTNGYQATIRRLVQENQRLRRGRRALEQRLEGAEVAARIS
ncbi:Coiled-coil domain-containing protein 13 [Cladochytrium tenue]|nr:Coiled-coil domain-containing protein 13 [Cladochytrium tenue]